MLTKTKAKDADGKPLHICEPIYFYVNIDSRNAKTFKICKAQVMVDGAPPSQRSIHEPSYEQLGHYYHCFLCDEQGENLTQDRSTNLTTRSSSALKLLEKVYKEYHNRELFYLDEIEKKKENCLNKIKELNTHYTQCVMSIKTMEKS
jgi:hypothetical protein